MKLPPKKFSLFASYLYKTISRERPIKNTVRYETVFGVLTASLGVILLDLGSLFFVIPLLATNMLIVPALRFKQAVTNLKHGRKTTKALVSIIAITTSILLGGFLGYYLFATVPMIETGLMLFSVMCTNSFTLIVATMLAAMILVEKNVLAVLALAILAVALSTVLPPFTLTLPLAVEAMFIGALVTSFAATLLSKHILRAYYYLNFGNTNADGYNITDNLLIGKKAALFGVEWDDFATLLQQCRNAISELKTQRNFLASGTLDDTATVGIYSYKNIHHALLLAETPADVEAVRGLLQDTNKQISAYENKTVNGIDIFTLRTKSAAEIRESASLSTALHLFGIKRALPVLTTKKFTTHELSGAIQPFINTTNLKR